MIVSSGGTVTRVEQCLVGVTSRVVQCSIMGISGSRLRLVGRNIRAARDRARDLAELCFWIKYPSNSVNTTTQRMNHE